MTQYRNSVKIVADVLNATKEGNDKGVGVSHLLRKANLSYSRLTLILEQLVKSGLIDQISQERGHRYRLNERGYEFLIQYFRFEELTKSFGLKL
jgi:predicted transcriptional regulator